jgi:hypothetical protein
VDGSVPIQRIFALDAPLSGYATGGTLRGIQIGEFTGDQFFILGLEHNFRRYLTLASGIPWLYAIDWEFIIRGAIARTRFLASHPAGYRDTEGHLYAETGCGIGRILDLFRVDVTYRFLKPTGFHFTIGSTFTL